MTTSSKKTIGTFAYGRWDNAESTHEAFELVKDGRWTLQRFQLWQDQVTRNLLDMLK